jgi:hypothetical protein
MSAAFPPRPHWFLSGLLVLLLAGCATSSSTKVPSLPQPPQPPSLPAPPTTSPTAPQPQAKGKDQEKGQEKGGQGESPQKADEGEKGNREGATGSQAGSAGGASPTAGGSARTPDEQREALEGQLQKSMAEFDGILLEEQKALEEKQRKDPLPDRSGESSGGSGGGGGEGGEGEGKGGGGTGKDDRTAAEKRADAEAEAAEKQAKAGAAGKAGEAGQTGPQTADTATGGSTDAGRLEGGTPVTAPVEGGPAGPGSDEAAVPPDVGDGKDDDVVARQLREAALKEKDPAIREKLWEEYREYKKGTGKSGR